MRMRIDGGVTWNFWGRAGGGLFPLSVLNLSNIKHLELKFIISTGIFKEIAPASGSLCAERAP